MDKTIKIHFFLCLAFLTSCDWFSSNKSSNTSVPDSYSAEFELTEEVPNLTACQGTRTIDYRLKTCFKNGIQTDLSNCSNISKNPLEVKSPIGSRTVSIEGEESNFIGDKTYSCDEGESMSEDKVDVTCSDSRYVRYSLNDNGIMDACKPYPINVESGFFYFGTWTEAIIVDSIGDVYEATTCKWSNCPFPKDLSIKKINFPKVINASLGYGAVCGYTADNKVFCQQPNPLNARQIIGVKEIEELSRNIKINKMVRHGNLICVLYEDKEVGCSQSLRGLGSPGPTGTWGSEGRGLEISRTENHVIYERAAVLIPEYFGAIDIVAGGGGYMTSCALFEDGTTKCSGYLGKLQPNINAENNFTYIPIKVDNKVFYDYFELNNVFGPNNDFNFSYCPFIELSLDGCLFIAGTNLSEYEKIIKRTHKNVYVSSLGKTYTYWSNASGYGYIKYNDLVVDVISVNGKYVIQNKILFANISNPVIIRLYK